MSIFFPFRISLSNISPEGLTPFKTEFDGLFSKDGMGVTTFNNSGGIDDDSTGFNKCVDGFKSGGKTHGMKEFDSCLPSISG